MFNFDKLELKSAFIQHQGILLKEINAISTYWNKEIENGKSLRSLVSSFLPDATNVAVLIFISLFNTFLLVNDSTKM